MKLESGDGGLSSKEAEARPGIGRWDDGRTVVAEMKEAVRAFTAERDWDRFHTAKNLAIALSVEAGELLQLFLWVDDHVEGSRPPPRREVLEAEIADVAICLLHLCNAEGVDLARAVERKLAAIADRYPAQKVRGSALKYDEYDD